jgi:hypothetical protein
MKKMAIGRDISDPAKAEMAAPLTPNQVTNGTIVRESPTTLVRVINITMCCFFLAMNTELKEYEIPLTTPRKAKVLTVGTIEIQFEPSKTRTTGPAKINNKTASTNIMVVDPITSLIMRDLFERLLDCMWEYIGNADL